MGISSAFGSGLGSAFGFGSEIEEQKREREYRNRQLDFQNARLEENSRQFDIIAPRQLALAEKTSRDNTALANRNANIAGRRLETQFQARQTQNLGGILLRLRDQDNRSNVVRSLLDPNFMFVALDPTITEGIASDLRRFTSQPAVPGQTLQNAALVNATARNSLSLRLSQSATA